MKLFTYFLQFIMNDLNCHFPVQSLQRRFCQFSEIFEQIGGPRNLDFVHRENLENVSNPQHLETEESWLGEVQVSHFSHFCTNISGILCNPVEIFFNKGRTYLKQVRIR